MASSAAISPPTIDEFYRVHGRAVYAFLLSRVRDPVLAEDLLQDTFVRATRAMAGYRGGSPRAWLLSIAYSALVDATRRRVPTPTDDLPEVASREVDVAERMLIDQTMERLAPRQQTALLLVDAGGASYAEAAEIMDTTLSAFKVLLHRARLSFRRHYEELNDDR